MDALAARTKETQAKMSELNHQEEGKRTHLFETQRKLNARRDEARQAEHVASEAAVELARWETRRDAFLAELRMYRPDLESTLDALAKETGKVDQVDALLPQLSRVRSQLEWIGNIDPATQKEYTETKERFEFLTTQVEDLRGAIRGLDTVIAELDETIRTKSEQAFHILNSEFSKTFRSLFGGGEAALLQVAPEPMVDEEGNITQPPADAPAVGIDIQATPPGKRLKSIALLSGGERALTSIALISAIMATNPSPFIVLDEVDAALDEVNTKKYADILEERANATQFIVVTHNRTTMHQSNAIYGVTLGEEGASKVLSVRLEEVGELQGK
jgi:chromosome segregation protein